MKKTILLAFYISISTVIFAQGGIDFGIKGGLNLAHLHKSSFKIRPGIHAGVFADYTINKYFGIQGELLYSMMGAKEKYAVMDGYYDVDGYVYKGYYDVKATLKNDYIVLPILAKLYMAKGFSLDLGPQFGYMISKKEKINISGDKPATWYYPNGVDNKFDIAFAMGLSYKLNKRFDISGRYNLGLTDVGNGYKSKNNVIQFGIGYRLK